MDVQSPSFIKKYALWFAFTVLLAIVFMPTPEGLPVAGKRMLGILVFSVIVWMTETVSYPVSAAVIVTLMDFLWTRRAWPRRTVTSRRSAGLRAFLTPGFRATSSRRPLSRRGTRAIVSYAIHNDIL